MGVAIPLGYVEDRSSGALVVDGSLGFDSSKSHRLSRTFSSGNRNTWTWSGWVKKNLLDDNTYWSNFFGAGTSGGDYSTIGGYINNFDDFGYAQVNSSSVLGRVVSNARCRDTSSWYHFVLSYDLTQSTSADRIKIYINGSQITSLASNTYPNQNAANSHINNNVEHYINGRFATYFGSDQFAQWYFIDGQALDASYFGYTDALTNTWRPKKFISSYNNTKFNSVDTVWSNNLTLSGGSYASGREPQYGFDGNLSTACQGGTNGTSITINSLVGLVVDSSIEFYSSFGTAGNNTFTINGSASATMSSLNTWTPVSFTGTITSAVISSSSQNPTFSAIRIDGQILVDGAGWGKNGFYLPFDGSAPIGQDQSGRGNNWTPVNFGGSNTLEKATGALPILNTDGGGKVARVGVRTDSSASSLVLALPLVGIKSDFSNAINSGTSNKAITAVGSVVASNSSSMFYGGSFYFDGNADCIDVAASSDFSFGTGDFTVEGWVNTSTYSSDGAYRRIFMTDGPTGNASGNFQIILNASDGALYLWSNTGDLDYVTSGIVANGNWNHIAACRSGSTLRAFVNGIQVGSTTYSGSISPNGGTPRPRIGNYDGSGGSGDFNGYIQDVRIYKGLAKYTQNFIPASTYPDILPDTPSGVSYSSNLTQITDGAISSGSASSYLTLASSADFGFGTGDFTVEFFVYETSKVYGSGSNPRVFDFGNTLQMLLHIPSDGGTIRIDYADSTLMTSNGTLFVNKWNHIALVRSGSTLSLYINGVFDKSVSNSTNVPTPSSTIYIGRYYGSDSGWINGFISNFHVVKGTALYTSNFTPPTGPISSVANTKLLCCKSNSSATAFDVSPGTITANGNAAATNFNPFTVNINTQRGKQSGWATLNPTIGATQLGGSTAPTYADGNSKVSFNGAAPAAGTIGVISGKWYFEVLVNSAASNNNSTGFGIRNGLNVGAYTDFTGYFRGVRHNNSGNLTYSTSADTGTSAGAIMAAGEVYGLVYDVDNNYFALYKNGIILVSSSSSSLSGGTWFPYAFGDSASGSHTFNFGQKPFKFPPPAGFQPLALANTPRPTIVRPDQFVGVSTWSGAQSGSGGLTRQISLGMQPDFVWIKQRNQAYSTGHQLYDSVRGAGAEKELNSSGTAAEGAGNIETYGWLNSFDKTGFTVKGGSSDYDYVDKSGVNYVAWAWKAGGNSNTYNINDVGYATASAAGLTAGTITPTGASVNTKSGFSIITYTGNGTSGATVSHGLGNTPGLLIVKRRSNTGSTANWAVWHSSLTAGYNLFLNSNDNAQAYSPSRFTSTIPTSTVFSLGSGDETNYSGGTFVSYLWTEIPGFSKFGSYTGTDTSNYIHLGFRPALVIIKNATKTSSAFSSWMIQDAERSPYNPTSGSNKLWANRATQEGYRGDGSTTSNLTANDLDFDSNGFYIPSSASTELNETGQTFIFAAFAETPTQNLYGAQANAR